MADDPKMLDRAVRGTADLNRRLAAAPFRALFARATPAWRDRAFVSGLTELRDTWCDYLDRVLRYDVYWAFYEGTAYRAIHRWAEMLKLRHGLYDHIRAIRSPAKRVVDFWAGHTFGGTLDLDAGDGKAVPSAIPIVTDHAALRPPLAQLWRDSVWQANKDTFARLGACHGDVFLQAVDESDHKTNGQEDPRVYFRVRSAREVYDVRKDCQGNVRGYTIVELRPDPREFVDVADAHLRRWVNYVEVCVRGKGDEVWYSTFLDSEPWDWREYPDGTPDEAKVGSEWAQHYGFVPLVHVQNRDMGKGWGWSAYQGSADKIFEIDDIASKVNDQIRKTVDAKWAASGVAPGDLARPGDEDGDDEGSRDDEDVYYLPKGATMHPLVAPMHIKQASDHLVSMDRSIGEDFPELMAEDVSADASGEARRVARERVEAEVVQHRARYEAPLVTMQKMCLSIGAQKGYPGFEAFTADSYALGELDHAIGDRPVFAVSEAERIAQATQQSTIIANLVHLGGMPLGEACRIAGLPDDRVRAIVAAQKQAAVDAEASLRAGQVATLAGDGGDGP